MGSLTQITEQEKVDGSFISQDTHSSCWLLCHQADDWIIENFFLIKINLINLDLSIAEME